MMARVFRLECKTQEAGYSDNNESASGVSSLANNNGWLFRDSMASIEQRGRLAPGHAG
jgi:hypothetical protein